VQKKDDAKAAMDEWTDSLDLVTRSSNLICGKAEVTGPLHMLTIFVCISAYFFDGWVRWVEGALVAASVVGAYSMRSLLTSIRQAKRTLNEGDNVLANHIRMNVLGGILFGYALLAIWCDWPVPIVAVFLASCLNYVHYVGYRNSVSN
jgi:hypothetical protein